MGDEARCTVRFGDDVAEGKALLESEELIFRGRFRLAIRLADVRSVEAEDGRLTIGFPAGEAVFELGPRAERWAERIRNPKTLLDKLGVKPGARVSVVGVADETFLGKLRERAVEGAGEPELVFLGAESVDDLDRLGPLAADLAADAAIWVVAPKGRQDIREADVLTAGRAAGLTDTKVAKFSDTHTAHKFVVPVAKRAARRGT